MGNPAGVRRDFKALETRRRRGMRLLDQGVHQSEVARRVGVSPESVRRWRVASEGQGAQAVRGARRVGRKPKLAPAQLRAVALGLKRGPGELGYETALWTSARVADLIERETGVRYHSGHVWKILRRLGWSCQRPTGRALERNEVAIRHWKRVTWPALKKKPLDSAKPSSSLTRAD
ncbi:MAG: IS630 family transposase [Terriglobales bacterium]